MAKSRRKQGYASGYTPANAVAWCRLHDRGMNYKYIRQKRCLFKGPCKHLHWHPPPHNHNTT